MLEYGREALLFIKEDNMDELKDQQLFEAVAERNLVAVKTLLADGANPNAKSIFNNLALNKAVELEDAAIAKALLDGGANPAEKDVFGKAALHVAIDNYSVDMAKLLLQHKTNSADPNQLDGTEQDDAQGNAVPPVILAAYDTSFLVSGEQKQAMFQVLISTGADIQATNKRGETVFDILKDEALKANVTQIDRSFKEQTAIDAAIKVTDEEPEYDDFGFLIEKPVERSSNGLSGMVVADMLAEAEAKNQALTAELTEKDAMIDKLSSALTKADNTNQLLMNINTNQAMLIDNIKGQLQQYEQKQDLSKQDGLINRIHHSHDDIERD